MQQGNQILKAVKRLIRNERLWQALLLALCALVFLFALHAKTSQYAKGPVKASPITASKLWLNGQKLHVKPITATPAILFWIATLCLLGLPAYRVSFVERALQSPPPRPRPLQHLHRFLRPPPYQP